MKKTLPVYISILTLLFFLSAPQLNHAQNAKVKVSGAIMDSAEKKPVSFVTVNLYKRGQLAQPFKSTYTDNKGKFQFAAIDTGRYVLIITHTGFTEKRKPIAVNEALELGNLEISRQSVTLKGVSVVGTKPLIEQQDDKIIFNVENDPDSKTATTLDIFRKTPYLSVDGDDNVQMNGQTNFKVLLNGRETSMFARNVKEALRAFPATLISRVEVITTPPAKYDAEGIGGIINIVTKKKVQGYNGSVSTFNRTGAKQNNGNVNLNVKTGKVGLSFFTFVNGVRNQRSKTYSETVPKTSSLFTKRTVSDERRNTNYFFGGESEISWEMDSLNTLSVYGEAETGRRKSRADRVTNTDFPSSPSSTSFQDMYGEVSEPAFDVGADYIKKYKIKDKEFSIRGYAEFGISRSEDESEEDNPGTDRFIFNQGKVRNNNYTLQSDYILPLPKNNKLEMGAKLILREASTDFQSSVKYDPMQDFKIDPNNSDYFSYSQHIVSTYSTYTFRTKKTTFRIGSRLEFTGVDGDFVSSNTKVHQRYANLVPFLQSITRLNPKYTFLLTYSRRLRRPGIWNLNPFVDNTDSLDIVHGNPELGPETVHTPSTEIRYQKGSTFASLGLQAFITDNLIVDFTTFDPVTGVTERTSDNLGKGFQLNLNTSLNTAINPKLNLNINGSLQYTHSKNILQTSPIRDGLGGNFTTVFNYKLSKKTNLIFNFNINRGPRLLQILPPLNVWYVSVFAFKLFKDKLNMSFRAANFLQGDRDYRTDIEDTYFHTVRIATRPVRCFIITMNYSFGKLKENVSKKGVSNDDQVKSAQETNN